VYSITGYILDDEASGLNLVTVTLSGDASAEAISGAGLPIGENEPGLYRFTGLSNGDYVVTPTKSGYKFVQPLENVTIAYDNEIVDDMVGTQIWVISGYILDGDSAGIEGVTITLTGDASTETETDADGYYEFDEMYDGDYTITPTLAGYYFTADHEDVTVDGDDVVVDTMVFPGYLTLPYTYNMSDAVNSSGGVSQEDSWTVAPSKVDGVISTTVADANGYTPAGVTKKFIFTWDGTRAGCVHSLPSLIDPSLTSMRVAILAVSAEATATPSFFLEDNATAESKLHLYIYGGDPTDKVTVNSNYESSTTRAEFSLYDTSVNVDYTNYHWLRAEWDFVAETVKAQVVRAETAASLYNPAVSMHADGIALGHVPSGLSEILITCQYFPINPAVAKIWIGTTSDTWPT